MLSPKTLSVLLALTLAIAVSAIDPIPPPPLPTGSASVAVYFSVEVSGSLTRGQLAAGLAAFLRAPAFATVRRNETIFPPTPRPLPGDTPMPFQQITQADFVFTGANATSHTDTLTAAIRTNDGLAPLRAAFLSAANVTVSSLSVLEEQPTTDAPVATPGAPVPAGGASFTLFSEGSAVTMSQLLGGLEAWVATTPLRYRPAVQVTVTSNETLIVCVMPTPEQMNGQEPMPPSPPEQHVLQFVFRDAAGVYTEYLLTDARDNARNQAFRDAFIDATGVRVSSLAAAVSYPEPRTSPTVTSHQRPRGNAVFTLELSRVLSASRLADGRFCNFSCPRSTASCRRATRRPS